MVNRKLLSSGIQLRRALGERQVLWRGKHVSFSQNGGFKSARRNGQGFAVNGPVGAGRLPLPRLMGTDWENKDFIVTASGQSVANGAGTGLEEDESGTVNHGAYSLLPPIPGKLLVVTGGTVPNQAGPGSPSNAEVIDPSQYATLVDAREQINTGRDPGKDVDRETPGLHFALHLANALPDSSRVILITWAAGSSDAADVIGTFASPAIPAQNAETMIDYVANTILAARTVRYLAHVHYGHEGNSADGLAVFYSAFVVELRSMLNAWGTLVDAAAPVPKMIWTCVGTPRRKWNDDAARVGEASWHARGQHYVIANSLDPAFAAFNLCFGKAAADTVFATPHYDPDGYPNLGQKAGAVLIDMLKGTYTHPPYMVDDGTAYRVVNSSVINATVTREVVSDTSQITTPGAGGGIQAFNYVGDDTQTEALDEKTISSVSCVGTALTVTLSAPGDPRREQLGSSFKNATQVDQWCGLEVTGASYSGGVVTLTVDRTLLLEEGDTFTLLDVYGAGTTGPFTATAGTTGSTLKYASVSDPTGGFTAGGNVVKDASFCLGRTHGLRTTWRATQVRHYSVWDGSPLPDYMLPQLMAVKTYCSLPGLAAQIAQLNTYIPGGFSLPVVFDVADSACYGGSGQTVTNLGSTGTTDDLYLGSTSGSASDDPTFVGSAGSLDRSTYFQSDGGDYFSPKAVSTFSRSAHQAGGCISGFVVGKATVGSSQWFGATCTHLAGGGAGWGLQLASNGRFQVVIRGASNALAYSLANTSVTLATGDRFVVGFCVKDGAPSWVWVNGSLVSTSLATFSSPSSGTSQAAFQIGINPGGTVRLSNGTQFNEAAYSTTYYEFGDLQPLLNSIYRRHIEAAY